MTSSSSPTALDANDGLTSTDSRPYLSPRYAPFATSLTNILNYFLPPTLLSNLLHPGTHPRIGLSSTFRLPQHGTPPPRRTGYRIRVALGYGQISYAQSVLDNVFGRRRHSMQTTFCRPSTSPEGTKFCDQQAFLRPAHPLKHPRHVYSLPYWCSGCVGRCLRANGYVSDEATRVVRLRPPPMPRRSRLFRGQTQPTK